MNISVVEANMTGLQHSYPNGIYVNILRNIIGEGKLFLYCSEEHFSNLGIQKQDVIVNYIKVLKPGKYRIIKFFLEYFQTMKIIKNTDSELIIFLSSFPNVQFFHTLFHKKFKTKKIIIMTHGEAEGLIMNGRKWKFWSYPFWISKCFKLKLPTNMSRIVLGKSIKENINQISNNERIFFIDQPRENFKTENQILPNKQNNIFAYIGNCLYKKGGNTFIKASSCLETNSASIFKIIGAYDLTTDVLNERIVLLGEPHKMIPRAVFEDSLQTITYACFPYPSNTYKFTASGAVLDALIYLKPIIYIKNDYFDGIFSEAGDIGYRCKDEEEFIETIRYLDMFPDEERYKNQVRNLLKLQEKFSIKNIEKQMSNIIQSVMEK